MRCAIHGPFSNMRPGILFARKNKRLTAAECAAEAWKAREAETSAMHSPSHVCEPGPNCWDVVETWERFEAHPHALEATP